MSARPLSLQARLMAAVIGFVSLILVIVAIITSATLGTSLEQQLAEKLASYSVATTRWVTNAEPAAALTGTPLTAEKALQGQPVPEGMLLAIQPPGQPATGATVAELGRLPALSSGDLFQITEALRHGGIARVSLPSGGSYLVTASQTGNGTIVVTGLSRSEVLGTLGSLFTVIALATLGGLLLLALTTALTISMSLRPLRAVAATATRVAGQPLDRGEVSITERVPDYEADPRTEVGRVGAALNTLLDHVDSSLSARQRNEERMRRFVADASHELRTPLASIRGYSELSLKAIKQAQDADQSAQTLENTTSALERIQAQSLRMTRLVEDLLLLARLDEGRELMRSDVDLTRLAVEALTDAQPTALDHRWELTVPDEPVMLSGDAGRLHQVLANLLANARTHTPAGTTITLSLSTEDSSAVLRVHDDGPGIDPEVRDELFARFARGDASRARKTGGTGLGLAIAKAIVEGHGGTVTVTSEPGDTTFTVRLPLLAEATPQEAAPAATAQ